MTSAPTLPPWYHSLAPFRDAFQAAVPVLMYHKILRPPRDAKLRGLFVAPELFRRQMRELRDAGFTTAPLGPGREGNADCRVVITFDDGFVNVLEHALPVLREHGFQAIQFIVADRIGTNNAWDVENGERSDPLMDDAQLRDWLAAGQVIGSHSLTHPYLDRLPLPEVRREVFESKRKLEDRFGVAVEHFCYPYGAFTPAVRDLVAEAGYLTACTVEAGVNTADSNPLELRRWLVRHRQPGLLAHAPFLPAAWF